jgi:hypothetical protein
MGNEDSVEQRICVDYLIFLRHRVVCLTVVVRWACNVAVVRETAVNRQEMDQFQGRVRFILK